MPVTQQSVPSGRSEAAKTCISFHFQTGGGGSDIRVPWGGGGDIRVPCGGGGGIRVPCRGGGDISIPCVGGGGIRVLCGGRGDINVPCETECVKHRMYFGNPEQPHRAVNGRATKSVAVGIRRPINSSSTFKHLVRSLWCWEFQITVCQDTRVKTGLS